MLDEERAAQVKDLISPLKNSEVWDAISSIHFSHRQAAGDAAGVSSVLCLPCVT